MIRVLLVDDSEVFLMILQNILEKEQDISVIGTARSGPEAIRLAARLAPDIITMDINMPELDGFETTRKIMETTPVPIIIVSGIHDLEEIQASFRAVEAGALAVFRKPPALSDPEFQSASSELVYAVRIFSEVKVIRRRTQLRSHEELAKSGAAPVSKFCKDIRVIVIGASTGGPQTIQEILKDLPSDFSLPMLLVQHMSPGFIEGLGVWLTDSTGFPTRIAEENEPLQPGTLLLAPDGVHVGITPDMRIEFSHDKPEHNLRPSVSYLFRSAAEHIGKHCLGVLLTGMGSDGADGLLSIKRHGGCTIIQDRESSYIYGMPGAAKALDAGMFSLSPSEIAMFLTEISKKVRND